MEGDGGKVVFSWKSVALTKISVKRWVLRQSEKVQPAIALAGVSVPNVV